MLERSRLKPNEKHTDAGHLRLIRQCQCLACGAAAPSEAAHVRFSSHMHGKVNPGIGRKPADKWVVPLCARCHRIGREAQHSSNELHWWESHGIDVLGVAASLHQASVTARARKLDAIATVELLRTIVSKARRGMR